MTETKVTNEMKITNDRDGFFKYMQEQLDRHRVDPTVSNVFLVAIHGNDDNGKPIPVEEGQPEQIRGVSFAHNLIDTCFAAATLNHVSVGIFMNEQARQEAETKQ